VTWSRACSRGAPRIPPAFENGENAANPSSLFRVRKRAETYAGGVLDAADRDMRQLLRHQLRMERGLES
jgi:hypothetical protein